MNLTAFEAIQHAIYALENQNGGGALTILRDFVGSARAQAAVRPQGAGAMRVVLPAGRNPPEPEDPRPDPTPPPPPPNETTTRGPCPPDEKHHAGSDQQRKR